MAPTGPIAAEAGAGLGVFALAALGIGVAIGIAAVGMAELIKAFGTMNDPKLIMAAAAGQLAFGASIVVVAAGLAGLSNPLSWAGVAVIGAVGLAALAMGKGIQWATTGVSAMVDSMAALSGVNSPFTDLVAGLKSIREEIEEIDESKTKTLTKLLQAGKDVQMNLSTTETMRLATINRETVRAQNRIPFVSAPAHAAGGTAASQRLIITLDAASTKALLEGKAAEAVGRAAAGAIQGEQ